MTTDVIELICEKLGTTIEKLVPAVIEYGTYKTKTGLTIWGIVLAVSIFIILLGFTRKAYATDLDIVCWVIGGIIFGIFAIFVIIELYDLKMWNNYPEMRAYETIMSWVRHIS